MGKKQSFWAGNYLSKAWRRHSFKGPKIRVNIKDSNAFPMFIHWEND